MSYWIITIGTEITTGLISDTNSQWIANRLSCEGMACSRQVSVGDDLDEIANVVTEALEKSDGAIITGGLGPTADDLTREGVAKAFGTDLELVEELKEYLDGWYQRFHGSPPHEMIYRQAYLPKGALRLEPTTGSAAGFVIQKDGKVIAVFPGVPREMREMLEEALPLLKEKWGSGRYCAVRTIKTAARNESRVEIALGELMTNERVRVGILAAPGEVRVQLRAETDSKDAATALVDAAEAEVRRRLGRSVFGVGDETLSGAVAKLLIENELTLSLAESCTGGLIAKLLTDIPGSSVFLKTGVVSYSNEAKADILGVDERILRTYGAVSPECALAMAQGVKRNPASDIGLSVTGIAGPSGGTAEKPVGLVFIGLAAEGRNDVWEHRFQGTRPIIRERAAKIALDILRNHLLDLGER